MPQDRRIGCVCYEARVKPDEVEGIVDGIRKRAPGVVIQVFSEERTPSLAAVEMIAAQTLAASISGSTLAQKPELDLLLRLAGTRQIRVALGRSGYKAKRRKLFLVAACQGGDDALRPLKEALREDGRFVEIPRSEPSAADLERVERAALLSASV